MQNKNTEIYVELKKSLIANVIRIFEGYEYLAVVSVISNHENDKGLILLRCTLGTYKDVVEILENLPFDAKILENFMNSNSKKV